MSLSALHQSMGPVEQGNQLIIVFKSMRFSYTPSKLVRDYRNITAESDRSGDSNGSLGLYLFSLYPLQYRYHCHTCHGRLRELQWRNNGTIDSLKQPLRHSWFRYYLGSTPGFYPVIIGCSGTMTLHIRIECQTWVRCTRSRRDLRNASRVPECASSVIIGSEISPWSIVLTSTQL